jgi:hypothetical protein
MKLSDEFDLVFGLNIVDKLILIVPSSYIQMGNATS